MKTISYPAVILYGSYMYIIYQLTFLVRFGRFLSTTESLILNHFGPYLLGAISVLLLRSYLKKYSDARKHLYISFAIAIPFSFTFSLGGGLLGFPGIITFGLAPFFIALATGSFLARRLTKINLLS